MASVTFKFPANKIVSWYLTTQDAIPNDFKITSPNGTLLAAATIFGKNAQLSGFAVGSFTSLEAGDYKFDFPTMAKLASDTATVTNPVTGDTVCQTHQVAGERQQQGDEDYNDIFCTVTWYRFQG